MRLLDITLPGAEENLALDEALLEAAEQAPEPCETLRLWEPETPLVVIGSSSRMDEEVHIDRCREAGVPVLRRCSGGAAIVSGPGCLMYGVVLSIELRPQLCSISHAHETVLDTILNGLRTYLPDASRDGTSDLVLGGKKFSGNSLRVKRRHLLYHGTLLYDMPLQWCSRWLRTPPRQPEYRREREHLEFMTRIPISGSNLRRAIRRAWGDPPPHSEWPQARTAQLVEEKYSRDDWNRRR
jgi:lipoate-protein ligase A